MGASGVWAVAIVGWVGQDRKAVRRVSGVLEGSQWAKKLAAKKTRAGLSDFDRFKVMVAKKQKSRIIAQKIKELKA